MLRCLRIQNFAIIESLEVEFGEGLNIISGETGAGKSIIMDALSLALGNRASIEIIRSGANFAAVEALFEADNGIVRKELNDLGIDVEGSEIIVRRIIQRSGKSRAFINDMLVNLSTLQKVVSLMVDLCSQHDQKLLSSKEEQIYWLDRYADLTSVRSSVQEKYTLWKKAQEKVNFLQANQNERAQRIDFLNYQINEIEAAHLHDLAEDDQIEKELSVLNNAESLLFFAKKAESIIDGENESNSIADEVGSLLLKIDDLIQKDEKLLPAKALLNDLKIQLDEAGYFFRDYASSINLDEGRLDELNLRAKTLIDLKRKYGSTLQDVYNTLQSLKAELSLLNNHDESMILAKEDLHKMEDDLLRECELLTRERAKAASLLSKSIENELQELNLDKARLQIDINTLAAPTRNGRDEIRIMFAANPGEPLGELSKIASGGELSRIMLALHNVLSVKGGISVYLFDEVDTGIGGKTAMVVGKKLKGVASRNQVICITHLPQVACYASTHFRVEKSIQRTNKGEKTICTVIRLDEKLRTFEVARMLGGIDASPQAIANAKDLIQKASNIS